MLYNTMLYYAIHVYMRLRCGLIVVEVWNDKYFGAKMYYSVMYQLHTYKVCFYTYYVYMSIVYYIIV